MIRLCRLAFGVAAIATLLAAGPARAQGGGSPVELYQGGMARFLAGNFEQSFEFLDQLVKVFGKEPELRQQMDLAMYARACALYNLGRQADAIKAFEEYVAQYPDSKFVDESLFRIASSLQQTEQYDAAIDAYQKLRNAHPRSPFSEDALFQTGICRLIQDQSPRAAEVFAEFLRAYPESPLWAQAGAFRARALFDGGKPADAVAMLEILEKRPRSWSVVTYCNFLAFEVGDALFDDTEYEMALKAYRRVKPRQALLRHQQAHLRSLEAALEASRKAQTAARDMRSTFQEERRLAGDLAQGREMAAKLDALPDYDANLYHRIGRCFFNVDRYWEARAAFARVVQIATDEAVREAAHFDLILAVSRLRRFDDLLLEADRYLATYDPEGQWQ